MTRRNLFAAAGLAGSLRAAPLPRPRVACILNAFFPNSHADVFLSRMLDGYRLDGEWHAPRLQAVTFYVDQFPFNDMARDQAAEYGIRICRSVTEAIEDVDGIAVIGEHGDYPRTAIGNFQYPRKRYFDEITASFEKQGRVLPLFNDKYFSYEWAGAKSMYDRVKSMRIPFLCGSTAPISWRRPPLEFTTGTQFDELLAIGYGDLEEHAYHGIEVLQCIAEARRGNETGVAAVRYVEGGEVWNISPALRDAALAKRVNPPPEDRGQQPEAFVIRYCDGLRATVLNLNSRTRDHLLAARIAGDRTPRATCFYIALYTHAHWGFMVRAFEDLVITKRYPVPAARTLYANGIMLAGLDSRRRGGAWVDTPELDISYRWPR